MPILTKTFTGAQILLETFKKFGIDTVFGYPGGIVLNVYDELFRQNNIKHYLVRHEQAAIHAAEGYARACGKCGVAIVTSGPGATNIVTGLANAYLDGVPLVVITGQVSKNLLHKNSFQEVDIIDITKSCTKKNFQVTDVKELEVTVENAFNTAMKAKCGPVVVDITKNVFSEVCDFNSSVKKCQLSNHSFPDIKYALSEILNSKRPLILAGGGAASASNNIYEFAKLMNIPVVNTMMGLGNYPMSDENYLGMIGIFGHQSANKAIRESDLIIAAGTRFNDRISGLFSGKKVIHIDINKDEISKTVPAYTGIEGDAKIIFEKMIEEMKNSQMHISDNYEWIKCVQTYKTENILPDKNSDLMHSYEIIKILNDFIKDKDYIVTTEVGQHQVWAAKYLQFNKPGKFITSGGLGTMGFGFPAAIGACIADNFRPVVCIAGDGSIQMNIQELSVCADYNLPVKVLIFNNGYLGMVRQFQEKLCKQRYFATKISGPDFVKLAESYGVKGFRVNNLSSVETVLKEAFAHNGPVFIDFAIEPMELL